MKIFLCILLGVTFLVSSAQTSSATDYDWTKRKCERFLDYLDISIDDYSSASYSDGRSEFLGHYSRLIKLKITFCLKIVYGDDDYHSWHRNHEGEEWEEAHYGN